MPRILGVVKKPIDQLFHVKHWGVLKMCSGGDARTGEREKQGRVAGGRGWGHRVERGREGAGGTPSIGQDHFWWYHPAII